MAWAHIQSKGVQSGGAVASVSITLDSSTTAGSFLACVCGNYRNSGTGAGTTVTDNKGNTWVKDPESVDSNWSQSVHYAVTALVGASHQFTNTTASGSGFPNITALEYSGIDLADAFEASSAAAGTSTTPASNNVAVADGGLMVAGVTHDGNQTTITPDTASGWTQRAEDETVDSMPFCTIDRLIATAGNFTANWTVGASRSWRVACASFNAAAGGGGGRTTKNTRSWPLGMEIGMGWRMNL